jgi:hypothetical protein
MRRSIQYVALVLGLAALLSAPAPASADSLQCRWVLVETTTIYFDDGGWMYWETYQRVCEPAVRF